MDLKEIYEALAKVEGGDKLIEGVKFEIGKLRDESAAHRTAKAGAEAKLSELQAKVDELELKDKGDQTKAQTLKQQVEALTKRINESEKARQEAEQKRIKSEINSRTIEALTTLNAIEPKDLARLMQDNVVVNEDGSYSYKMGKEVTTIEDGAKDFLNM